VTRAPSHRRSYCSAPSIVGLGSHALTEAKALIIQHRDVVLAIANALMIHKTLDAVMIHQIIALAPERARRADWARTCANASLFKLDR
jgi:hypothetical protein